ncbi:MAG: hypothetical protein ACO4AI_13065 [Prochlorothrix sp.]|nr:hypothetical protein [Prochlorothrix sp.]
MNSLPLSRHIQGYLHWCRRLPKISLSLLAITYTVFGWYWSLAIVIPEERALWQLAWWPLLLTGALFLAAIMTGPLTILRSFALWWLASDVRSFITTMVASFFAVLLLGQMTLVTNVLILLSAMGLARLDLQTHEFHEWTAFWILSSIALSGLGLGGLSSGFWLRILSPAA